jgi:hypothetical protein
VTVSILISALALLVSAGSFAVNLAVGHRAAVRGRKPVLVFVDEPGDCWTLRNIGNGPAINVVVAQRKDGRWFNPVRVRPMAKDASERLEWLDRVNDTGLGVSYADSEQRHYTATLGAEILHVYDGRRLPDWDDSDVRRYWDVPRYDSVAIRWGDRVSDFRA